MMPDQSGFYITKKQASVTAAALVILGLFVFIAGYFLGKHSVIDGFAQRTSQESFNDQVDYLLTMQSYAAKNGGVLPEGVSISKEQEVADMLEGLPDALEENEEKVENTPVIAAVKVPEVKNSNESKSHKIIIDSASKDKESEENKSVEKASVIAPSKTGKHYAQLAGFAKKSSAIQMVDRLKKRHIEVEIKTKTSKSASGKTRRTWYQVVTKTYDSVSDVQSIVDKIVAFEKIKRSDVKVV